MLADVAKEQRPLAVGRQTHDLVYAGSVEVECVGAVLALDDVAAVARIPAEAVPSVPEQCGVVAAVPVDRITAVAADEELDSVAAVEGVAAVAAIDRQGLVRERPVGLVDAELVVAASGEHLDPAERAAVEAVLGRAVVTEVDLEGACCTGCQTQRDPIVAAVAVDGEGVVRDRG